ncbi:MAG TPA: hypothetical protein VMM17_08355 [Gemmatimonadaceae bacterium]|nr:hypothetical protein [Gemmatimonadaceae bacterium]
MAVPVRTTHRGNLYLLYGVVPTARVLRVLAAYGMLPSPTMGSILMSASTVIVAINAQLLRRAKL